MFPARVLHKAWPCPLGHQDPQQHAAQVTPAEDNMLVRMTLDPAAPETAVLPPLLAVALQLRQHSQLIFPA
jgi:hypothetical protein